VAIPEKREDLIAMGYVFDNEATCRGCGQPIEWWITPKNKKMPMSVKEVAGEAGPFPHPTELIRVPHFSDCPEASSFRKKK
jgi:hypothetical protein